MFRVTAAMVRVLAAADHAVEVAVYLAAVVAEMAVKALTKALLAMGSPMRLASVQSASMHRL